jgi:hypothetical protein
MVIQMGLFTMSKLIKKQFTSMQDIYANLSYRSDQPQYYEALDHLGIWQYESSQI